MLSHWTAVRLPWPRFRRPPCDPGRRVFPGPVLTLAFPSSPFHDAQDATADPERVLYCRGLLRSSSLIKESSSPGSVPRLVPGPPSAQSSFARLGCNLRRRGLYAPPRWALPHRLRYYVLMCQSRTLLPPRCYDLARQVFAGCCQPLLGTAPSRRYLCESFLGCLDLYPGGPHGAYARFFP